MVMCHGQIGHQTIDLRHNLIMLFSMVRYLYNFCGLLIEKILPIDVVIVTINTIARAT